MRQELFEMLGCQDRPTADKDENIKAFLADFRQRFYKYDEAPDAEPCRLTRDEDLQLCEQMRISVNARAQMKTILIGYGKDIFASTTQVLNLRRLMAVDELFRLGENAPPAGSGMPLSGELDKVKGGFLDGLESGNVKNTTRKDW